MERETTNSACVCAHACEDRGQSQKPCQSAIHLCGIGFIRRKVIFILCVSVCEMLVRVGARVLWHECGKYRTAFEDHFSPSTLLRQGFSCSCHSLP